MIAITAKNKSGVNIGGVVVETTDVTASFGIIGSSLGILLSLFALFIGLWEWHSMPLIAAWIFCGGVCLFFTCGALGIWSQSWFLGGGNNPTMWAVEMAVDIVSAALFIALMAMVTGLRGQRGDK